MPNIQEWFSYLETLPSGLTITSLDHVKKVAQTLGVTKLPGKIVTVAGTNGKGSCVVFLEAIFVAAGYKVGAYISPHLLRYNERIRINGESIDDDILAAAFAVVKMAQGNTTLSYFEFGTLVALQIFKQMELDVLLLEVGLGGRLDAVNIIDADVAVISTISLDHTAQLGNTRDEIGREKSGIMRKFKPVVCGDLNPPRSIYTNVNKTKAILYNAQSDFTYKIEENKWKWEHANWQLEDLPIPKLPLQNAATALMVITLLLPDIPVDHTAIVNGLKHAFLSGRFQLMQQSPAVIVDVAHNMESAALFASNLKKQTVAGRTLAVLSMLKDKDIPATLKPFISLVDKWYVGQLSCTRAASAEQLRNNLKLCGAQKMFFQPNVAAAFNKAIAEAKEIDRIIVFGSFYTAGEVLKIYQIKHPCHSCLS